MPACALGLRPWLASAAAVQHGCDIQLLDMFTSKECGGCSVTSVSRKPGLQRAKSVHVDSGRTIASKRQLQLSCWLEPSKVAMSGMPVRGNIASYRLSLTSEAFTGALLKLQPGQILGRLAATDQEGLLNKTKYI